MSNILLGVSGGVAIFKVAQLASNLSKKHNIRVIMSKHAAEFMGTEVFQSLSNHKVYTDTFDSYEQDGQDLIAHVELAKWADIIILAPATGNLLGKLANGIADDMLTTTLLAARSPILLAPAMNTYMLNNPATRDNLAKLENRGVEVMATDAGDLACGDFGNGKLASPEAIESMANVILKREAKEKSKQDLVGKHVLVTAGPTREQIDPVRFISNHSSGKQGYAVAQNALNRGASVSLITGPVSINPPLGANLIKVESADEMLQAVQNNLEKTDLLVMTAAVSDYKVLEQSEEKIKKSSDNLTIELVKNPDILKWAGENSREGQVLVGFAMETENLLENAREKLIKKNVDLIIANSLKDEGAGFGTDTNLASIISKEDIDSLALMSKYDLAEIILDRALEIYKEKN